MGQLDISKPFASYVSMEEIPSKSEVRQFVLRMRFQDEATRELTEMSWPWTQRHIRGNHDAKNGLEGVGERYQRELDNFRQHVEYELGAHGARAYAVNGSDVLVWAKVAA
jgi:hypothetical protein